MMLPFRLLVIADRGVCATDDEFLARVTRVGAVPDLWLQLRIKTLPLDHRLLLIAAAAESLGDARARTLVNGTLAEARDLACAGAHYPETALPPELPDRPGLLAGTSVHSTATWKAARRASVDYMIAGSVFSPSSKAGRGRGLDWLAKIARGGTTPVLAIGGITPEQVPRCLAAGAVGVAVLGGIFLSDDPGVAAAAYQRALLPA